jgi:hypothetical protein
MTRLIQKVCQTKPPGILYSAEAFLFMFFEILIAIKKNSIIKKRRIAL